MKVLSSLCVLFSMLSTEYVLADHLFKTKAENSTISGLEPFLRQDVTVETECYLLCKQSGENCWFVQLQNGDVDSVLCSLFQYVIDLAQYLVPSNGSFVSESRNPVDCLDMHRLGYTKDGVYDINFNGNHKKVFCDMTTEGGGWIVMQKRFDGSEDFNRDWADYKKGFGNVHGEHWLGNEFVHQYTSSYEAEMIAQATSFDDQLYTVDFNFALTGEGTGYKFKRASCTGTDSNLCLSWDMKGIPFSTPDRDLDSSNDKNCAVEGKAGWWMQNCALVNLNGVYSKVENIARPEDGITWQHAKGRYKSLKTTQMLIRRRL